MIYTFKSGARINLDPQVTGDFLEQIRGENAGQLTAESVVDAARPKRSPIHKAFEWDDSRAAEEYRREQARSLIRCVIVRMDEKSDAPPTVRAFVCVRHDENSEEKSYTAVGVAMADPLLREQVLHQAMAEAEAWRRRWAEYSELAAVFRAIEKAAGKLKPTG